MAMKILEKTKDIVNRENYWVNYFCAINFPSLRPNISDFMLNWVKLSPYIIVTGPIYWSNVFWAIYFLSTFAFWANINYLHVNGPIPGPILFGLSILS